MTAPPASDGWDEVVGHVDVPAERRLAHDPHGEAEAAAFGGVAPERAGAVGEAEADRGRDADDVGAVVAAVGHEGEPAEPSQPREVDGQRQVGVGDDDALRSRSAPSDWHAVGDGAVEAEARAPQHVGAGARSAHVRHVRRRRTPRTSGRRAGGGEHVGGHVRGPARRASTGSRAPARRTLAWRKSFTGTRTATPTRASLRWAACRYLAARRRALVTTIGTLGAGWRGVGRDPGAPWTPDGSASLDWWVAADDRWHTPRTEPSLRQRSWCGHAGGGDGDPGARR